MAELDYRTKPGIFGIDLMQRIKAQDKLQPVIVIVEHSMISQEAALDTLTTNFGNAYHSGASDPVEQTARDAYIKAILSKDSTAAMTAADSQAILLSARQRAMMEAEASFQTQIVSILNSDQVAALNSAMGNKEILRMLQSPIEPGPGFGCGLMSAGRMRPGNSR